MRALQNISIYSSVKLACNLGLFKTFIWEGMLKQNLELHCKLSLRNATPVFWLILLVNCLTSFGDRYFAYGHF